MSYRVGTTHYNLPQTEGTDKRDWFDTNEAFREVDEALYTASQGVGTVSATVEALETDVSNLQDGLSQTDTKVGTIETKQATDEENIAQNAQAISQLSTKVDSLDTDLAEMIEVTEEASATASAQHAVGTYFRYNDNLWITTVLIRVGDEIVPNVNCETTDVMSRVYALEHSGGGSVSADAVSFDHTGTDLVATNVQSAIVEVNSKIGSGGAQIDDTTTALDKVWSSNKTDSEIQGVANEIGDLSDLQTTDKSSVVDAVNEVKSDLDNEHPTKFDSQVVLNAYNTDSNPYTLPSDGYVGVTSGKTAFIMASDATSPKVAITGVGGVTAIFAKKGYRVYVDGTGEAYFTPLKM